MNYAAADHRGIKSSFRKAQRVYPWFDMLTTLSNVEGNLDSRFRGNDGNAAPANRNLRQAAGN